MTVSAQNALLKTIEEPAAYGIFIFLTTSVRHLLPTVLSRCVTYKLKPLPDELVRKAMGGSFDGVRFAYGSIGRAKELAASADFADMLALSREVAENISGMDIFDVMLLYRRFEKWKETIENLLDILYICVSEANADKVSAIIETKKKLQQNGNFQLCIEVMLLELR
jgi:DNA polymerase-3 subunit delta'